MGACASKFKVLKDAPDAPPPEELVSREVNLAEELVKKDDVAVDDEDKRPSLGHLFKENEGEKGKASEEVKQADDASETKPLENENVKSPEGVADGPVKDETEKAPASDGLDTKTSEDVDTKPASQNVEADASASQKKAGEGLAEATKLETSEKVETPKTGKPEENKPDEKPETQETKKTEEQKPTSDAEKKTEEKVSEETPKLEISETKKTQEQKPGSDVEKTKTEEKPAGEITKTTLAPEKVEDKQVVEHPKPAEEKSETSETKAKEQKEKAILGGEEK